MTLIVQIAVPDDLEGVPIPTPGANQEDMDGTVEYSGEAYTRCYKERLRHQNGPKSTKVWLLSLSVCVFYMISESDI